MGHAKSKARTAGQNRGGRGIAPNMTALVRRFGDEGACEEHMISLRWPGGFACPRCGNGTYARVAGRREFRCEACSWQFSATSGTMLAHTKLPLTSWFRAAFMVCADTRGASAQAVARELGVSDATGAAVLRRLRAAMGLAMALCRVGGKWVELDGASVACGNSGGGPRHAGSGVTDAPFELAVSGSAMAARAVSDVTAGSVSQFCAGHVSRLCPVRLDAHRSHGQALSGGWDAVACPSGAEGDAPESLPAAHHVISNIKAKLEGTHHGVSWRRLQEYLDEFSWKYSHKHGDQLADLLRELCRWPHVPLREIRSVAGVQPPHEGAPDPGYYHNRTVERKARRRLFGELATDVALVAGLKARALTHL